MSNRVGYIDIARGIGILLVVVGHNDFRLFSQFAYQVIYSFHMPLFFFLSGYFFNSSIDFKSFVIKKFNTLLKPYLFTIFVIYFVSTSFDTMSFQTALGRIVKSLYASGRYINWAQLWFLPHLFAVSIYAFFFYKIFAKVDNRFVKWAVLLSTLLLANLFLKGYFPFILKISGKEYELFGLPFSLDLLFLSGFFFILGGEIRRIVTEKTFKNPFIFFGSAAGIILLNLFFSPRNDFNTRVYESLFINTMQAIVGILFILALSGQVELHSKKLAALLGYFGRISMIILIFHVPVQDFWAQKILTLTNNISFSIWGGFIMGVAGSVLIYELFIKFNPVASWWLGRQAELPKQIVISSKD